jgi:hypothetical protein
VSRGPAARPIAAALRLVVLLLAVVGPAAARPVAAADSRAEALFDEGTRLYDRGDMAAAARVFREAAERGHARAQVQIGWHYEFGRGVPRDYDEAWKWYRRAAAQGDPTATSNIGGMHFYGKGVPASYAEALRYYRPAALAGERVAQFQLGYMYEYGLGVARDVHAAYQWYYKARVQGDSQARKAVDDLAPAIGRDLPWLQGRSTHTLVTASTVVLQIVKMSVTVDGNIHEVDVPVGILLDEDRRILLDKDRDRLIEIRYPPFLVLGPGRLPPATAARIRQALERAYEAAR